MTIKHLMRNKYLISYEKKIGLRSRKHHEIVLEENIHHSDFVRTKNQELEGKLTLNEKGVLILNA